MLLFTLKLSPPSLAYLPAVKKGQSAWCVLVFPLKKRHDIILRHKRILRVSKALKIGKRKIYAIQALISLYLCMPTKRNRIIICVVERAKLPSWWHGSLPNSTPIIWGNRGEKNPQKTQEDKVLSGEHCFSISKMAIL